MPPQGKRIMSQILEVHRVGADVPATAWYDAEALWTADRDVTIIGSLLSIEQAGTNLNFAMAEISLVARHVSIPDGSATYVIDGGSGLLNIFHWGLGVVGGAGMTMSGLANVVMFPEGYGVEVDRGESVNLHNYYAIGEGHDTYGVIFYVER